MPRKRRKRIATDGAPDIPYPRVRVEWIDCVSDSGWATDKEFDKMKLARPVNEGWLYSKDNKSIKLFASCLIKTDDSHHVLPLIIYLLLHHKIISHTMRH